VRTRDPGKAALPDVQHPGSCDPSRSSAQSAVGTLRVELRATLAGVITKRIFRLGAWPTPCLLHVCSAVAVPSGSARYLASAKWAESRTKWHCQALSGSGRTRNSALLIPLVPGPIPWWLTRRAAVAGWRAGGVGRGSRRPSHGRSSAIAAPRRSVGDGEVGEADQHERRSCPRVSGHAPMAVDLHGCIYRHAHRCLDVSLQLTGQPRSWHPAGCARWVPVPFVT
jgi:hypothetical protein